MNIISLQHIAIEDPGYIKDLLLKEGHTITTVQLDQGDKIPDGLGQFDAMFCMGGPMEAWMEKEYPWLVHEKQAIKHFVKTLQKPFLGFCLGVQLLGEMVGGKVVKSNTPEIGVLDVDFIDLSKDDIIFNKLPKTIKAVQWHSYEVQDLEQNSEVAVLASSEATKYQVFRYQQHAYGVQFHLEIRKTTVNDWFAVKEYKEALINTLGDSALKQFVQDSDNHIDAINTNCELFYNGLKQLILDNN